MANKNYHCPKCGAICREDELKFRSSIPNDKKENYIPEDLVQFCKCGERLIEIKVTCEGGT